MRYPWFKLQFFLISVTKVSREYSWLEFLEVLKEVRNCIHVCWWKKKECCFSWGTFDSRGGTFTLGLRSLPCCISVPTVNQKLLARLNSLTVLSRGMSSLSGSKALMWLPWWQCDDPPVEWCSFKNNYITCT